MKKRKKPIPKYRTLQEQRALRAIAKYNKKVMTCIHNLRKVFELYSEGQRF